MSGAWIGVDLDGTLAFYNGWIGPDHIGPPIPAMVERVQDWVAAGKRVKIFTARTVHPPIIRWLESHGLGSLEITNIKDSGMVELWDDRCVRVIKNTGRVCCGDRG